MSQSQREGETGQAPGKSESEERFRSLLELSTDAYAEQDAELRLTRLSGGAFAQGILCAEKMLGKPPMQAGLRVLSRERWRQLKQAVSAHRAFRDLEVRCLGTHGQTIFLSISGQPVFDIAGRFTGYRSIARDITEAKQRETALHRQNELLNALNKTALALVNRLEPDDLLETMLARAAALLRAPHGFLYLVEPSAGCLELKVGCGAFQAHVGLRVRAGEGLSGRVWQSGAALMIADYSQWAHRVRHAGLPSLGANLAVPLAAAGATIGVLGVALDAGDAHAFGETEIQVVARFAQLAALTLENARLYSAEQRARSRLQLIAENVPAAISTVDAQERFQFVRGSSSFAPACNHARVLTCRLSLPISSSS